MSARKACGVVEGYDADCSHESGCGEHQGDYDCAAPVVGPLSVASLVQRSSPLPSVERGASWPGSRQCSSRSKSAIRWGIVLGTSDCAASSRSSMQLSPARPRGPRPSPTLAKASLRVCITARCIYSLSCLNGRAAAISTRSHRTVWRGRDETAASLRDCDHCGGRFGVVTHRWWGNKFCRRSCRDEAGEHWKLSVNTPLTIIRPPCPITCDSDPSER